LNNFTRLFILMKKIFLPLSLLLAVSVFAQTGYEIKVTFKPFQQQYIYLGHYFGKQYPIIDSAMLNEKSEAVFKGTAKLPGGIYLVGYPNKAGFFEILVDKQQHFSVIADTATIKTGIQFINSPDNVTFNNYQQFMITKGQEISNEKTQLKAAANAKDSTHWNEELGKTDKAIQEYREAIIKKNPDNLLSILFITMREPDLPGTLKDPKTNADSINAFNYYKQHFWDGVNFWDGRLAYTTLFEEKLDKYFTQLIVPNPDSVIKEIDWMLGYSSINEVMNRFLLLKFVGTWPAAEIVRPPADLDNQRRTFRQIGPAERILHHRLAGARHRTGPFAPPIPPMTPLTPLTITSGSSRP